MAEARDPVGHLACPATHEDDEIARGPEQVPIGRPAAMLVRASVTMIGGSRWGLPRLAVAGLAVAGISGAVAGLAVAMTGRRR